MNLKDIPSGLLAVISIALTIASAGFYVAEERSERIALSRRFESYQKLQTKNLDKMDEIITKVLIEGGRRLAVVEAKVEEFQRQQNERTNR